MEESVSIYMENEDESESQRQQLMIEIIRSQQKTIDEQNVTIKEQSVIISEWLMNDYLKEEEMKSIGEDEEGNEIFEFDNMESLFEKYVSDELTDDYANFFNKIEKIVKSRLRDNDEKKIADRYLMSNMLRLYLQRKLKYINAVINKCDKGKLKRPICVMKRRMAMFKNKGLINKDYDIECTRGRNSRKYKMVYVKKN
jgi:hypothetical protein